MNGNAIVVMTADQLREFAEEVVAQVMGYNADTPTTRIPADTKRYVYGLRGIAGLFNVSHATAQQYKNTWLAPAVIQRGRKIVVDAEAALALYAKRQ